MQQAVTDTEDMRYVVNAPSFSLQYRHVRIGLLSLEQGVVCDLLSRGWKICMNFLIELKKVEYFVVICMFRIDVERCMAVILAQRHYYYSWTYIRACQTTFELKKWLI